MKGRGARAAAGFFWLAFLLACQQGAPMGVSPPASKNRRIVVMAPAAAEMLDALGLGGEIVGVGDFVRWPPFVQSLPKVGDYNTPNVERVLELGATLLVTTSSKAGNDAHERLRRLGLRVVELKTATYGGVLESLTRLGAEVGRGEEARNLVEEMQQKIAALREEAVGLPKRKVLFVVDRDPLYVAGPGSHIDEMIRAVGGENVAADALSSYQLVSLEAMLERMPEVIIDTTTHGDNAPRGNLPGPWGEWKFLPAVKEGRVYFVDPIRLVIPGMRLPEMTERMAQLIHPEIFGKLPGSEYGPLEGGQEAPSGEAP